MKSKILAVGILMMVLVFGVVIIGCEEDDKSPTYYYEAFRITMAQWNSFAATVTPGYNYTFSQIQGFRQTLKSYGGTFVESAADVSESELKSFANQHGLGGAEYTKAKNSLDSVGNMIGTFTYTPDPTNYIIWIYIEKE